MKKNKSPPKKTPNKLPIQSTVRRSRGKVWSIVYPDSLGEHKCVEIDTPLGAKAFLKRGKKTNYPVPKLGSQEKKRDAVS